MTGPIDRRGAKRFQQELEIELHSKEARIRLPVFDVSRHGMFIACRDPPPMNHAVLMTVRMRGGPFETMATVMRRVTEHPSFTAQSYGRGGSTPLGMGVKLFCLGADAKDRWDRYVALLEDPGVQLPTRPLSTSKAAACFLVQPETVTELLEFYTQNVTSHRTLFVSPAVRMLGALVQFVLVHPDTHEEHALDAKVVEWNADHPLRMGVRFEKVDQSARRAFRGFLGPVPGAGTLSMPEGAPLVPGGARPKWTEYAFFSPKVRANRDPSGEFILLDDEATPSIIVPPSPQELDVIEGEMLDLPALELVDKRELFDFHWNAEGAADDEATDVSDPMPKEPTDPTKKIKR
jgi:hypothetical protein